MEKPIYVDFSKEANIIYSYVSRRALSSKSERIMLTAILRNIERIKNNPNSGDCVPKRLIPEEYIRKYYIHNLYRMELPFFWRMLYTIKDDEIEIIAFVLDIADHKDYNKKFGYK
jgi:hypothetical protein